MKRLLALVLLALAVPGLAAAPARAADFSGKNIEWIIPFGPTGGSAAWAQFLAPQLGQALPGKPNVVIKYISGGGSTKGANLFAARAKPDGLTILGTSGSTQFPYLLGDKRVKYEYKDWTVILGSPTGGVFYVTPKLGIKGPQDIKKLKGKAVKYGAQTPTALDLVPLLALEMMGVPTKAVFGMKSRGAGRLAFERGEVNVDYQTSSAYIKNVVPLVKEGKAIPLWSWGIINDKGDIVRDPNFADLPHWAEAYEMMHGKKPRGPAYQAFKAFVAAGYGLQKMIFLPKGTPKDIVDAYRAAATQMVAAPDFAKRAAKVLGAYNQVTGKDADAGVKAATTVAPKSRQWVRDWLTKRYKVKF